MASIRRNQSPLQINGGYAAQSLPYNKINPSSKPYSLSSFLLKSLSSSSPRPLFSLYRYLLFFAFGFVLGLAPFGHVDDVRTHDFVIDQSGQPKQEIDMVSHVVFATGEDKKVRVNHPNVEVVTGEDKEVRLNDTKHVIIVTPTYNRAMQAYFLNRLGQVLKLVNPPLLWVVVEMNEASVETAGFLRKMGVMYRHLVCKENSTDVKDRGVHQRNTALEHIERHKLDGIVYFADDDNVYSLELFERLRKIRRFGTWPVAMLAHSKAKAILEGPVCNGSQVIGWHTNEKSKRLRRFHVDMSGFAFNSTILWDPRRWPRPTSNPIRQLDTVKEGFQETTFIEQVVEDEYQMEGITPNCSMIMNWHLHLEGSKFVYPRGWLLQKNLDVVLPFV